MLMWNVSVLDEHGGSEDTIRNASPWTAEGKARTKWELS